MHRDVKFPAVDLKAEAERRTTGQRGGGEFVAQRMRRFMAERAFDTRADQRQVVRKAKHRMGIDGMTGDSRQARVACDQGAVRLDRAGNMDRLAIAICKINGRVHGIRSR